MLPRGQLLGRKRTDRFEWQSARSCPSSVAPCPDVTNGTDKIKPHNHKTIGGNETLKLGKTVITALSTPGHTMGSMSWRWNSCEQRVCKSVVFAASLNPVSTDDYRYSALTARPIVAGFLKSYVTMRKTPCDILITAHPDNAGADRYNSSAGSCRAYAERSRKALDKRLESEQR